VAAMQAIEKEELNFSADNALYGMSESRWIAVHGLAEKAFVKHTVASCCSIY